MTKRRKQCSMPGLYISVLACTACDAVSRNQKIGCKRCYECVPSFSLSCRALLCVAVLCFALLCSVLFCFSLLFIFLQEAIMLPVLTPHPPILPHCLDTPSTFVGTLVCSTSLRPLVRCLEQHPSLLSLQRIGAWSLFNLFDGQPRPTVDVPTVSMVSVIMQTWINRALIHCSIFAVECTHA